MRYSEDIYRSVCKKAIDFANNQYKNSAARQHVNLVEIYLDLDFSFSSTKTHMISFELHHFQPV